MYLPYYTHLEIAGDPCNLIGPQQCDLFTNRAKFCSKSHLFPSHWERNRKTKQPIRFQGLFKVTNQDNETQRKPMLGEFCSLCSQIFAFKEMRELNYLQFPNDDNELVQANLVPRSPTVIRKGDLVKFDFEHAQCQRGPKYGLFYHCACSCSLLWFWVILRNKHGFREYSWRDYFG